MYYQLIKNSQGHEVALRTDSLEGCALRFEQEIRALTQNKDEISSLISQIKLQSPVTFKCSIYQIRPFNLTQKNKSAFF